MYVIYADNKVGKRKKKRETRTAHWVLKIEVTHFRLKGNK